MKALSIKQPWAFLIARGEKTIETRLWETDYRGELLIVASKTPDMYAMMDRGFDQTEFAYGKAVCIASLVDCRPMTRQDEDRAGCELYPMRLRGCLRISER